MIKHLIYIVIFIANQLQATEATDNYYSDSIHDAVNQAKARPHHYDYSNTYRYKRTTAQSIELNRLNLNELEGTYLRIDSDTLYPNVKLDITQSTIIENDMRITKEKSINIPSDVNIPVNTGSYQSQYGSHQSNDIINKGVVISTPRP